MDEKRLALFIRYGSTHERAFHKALNTLLRLQKDRRKTQLSPAGFVSQNASFEGLRSANLGEIGARNAPETEEILLDAA